MKNILLNKNYRISLIADLLSNFGDVLYSLALFNYVLMLPDTELAISIVSFSEVIPTATYLFSGYYSDRTKNKVYAILGSQLLRTLLYILLGFIMSFSPHLWVVIIASIINVFSDIAGQYESGLFIPLSLKMVKESDRQSAIAVRQGLSFSFSALYQPIGAILVGFFSYSSLAYLNAGTFFLSFILMLTIMPYLKQFTFRTTAKNSMEENLVLKEIYTGVRESISEIYKISELKLALFIVPIINALFSVVSILVVLMIDNDPHFIMKSASFTIATVNTSYIIGNILGSFLVTSLFKDTSMPQILKLGTIVMSGLFLGLMLHNFILVICAMFLGGILIGAGNPKYNLLIYNAISEERIAMVTGSLLTYFQFSMFIMRILVSFLVILITVQQITFVLFVISLMLISITFIKGN
ncbi:MFS transporter [Streptococcus ovuberis]|uniref:MFS transporter n=1 Tax=Streptococcus ovuberis TaxID=1936207 RepID=A0A7X6MYI5_9STRE|nr:MFS transporter [Streptococcus ovuberis]NKZ19721.1 MFS transporter [Streptococcus ovuberis]